VLVVRVEGCPRPLQVLRNPDGFEGFGSVEEDSDAADLSFSEVVDVRGRRIDADGETTGPTGSGDSRGGDDLVRPERLQAFWHDPEVRTCVMDVGEEPPNRVRTFVDPLNSRQWRPQLDVLRAAREVAVDVSLVDSGDCSLDNLHVRLRHRLLREVQSFKSFGVIQEVLHIEDLPAADRADPRQVKAYVRPHPGSPPVIPHENSVSEIHEIAE